MPMFTDQSKRGFTLIELMVVVGLIGLLTMFAIPAFQTAGQGGRLNVAAFQLSTTLSLARQQAISTRQRVFVVFPDDEDVLYTGANAQYRFKAFRAYAVYGERDGYLSEWRSLPPGLIIDPDYSIGGAMENFTLRGGGSMFLLDNIPFPHDTSPSREMYVVGFATDGPVHVRGTVNTHSPVVYLTEGWTSMDDAGGNFDWGLYRDDQVYRLVHVNAITGQTRIREHQR